MCTKKWSVRIENKIAPWGYIYRGQCRHYTYQPFLNESTKFNHSIIRLKAGIQESVAQFQNFVILLIFSLHVFSTDILGINKLRWWRVGWNAEEEFRPYSKSLL